jgi:hypothetical protein
MNLAFKMAQHRAAQETARKKAAGYVETKRTNPLLITKDDMCEVTPALLEKARAMVRTATERGQIVQGELVPVAELREDVRSARHSSNVDAVIAEAEQLRLRGNAAIQAGLNAEAAKAYTEASNMLAPHPSHEALWAYSRCLSNRAEALLRLRRGAEAVEDCTAVLDLLEVMSTNQAAGSSRCNEYVTLGAKVAGRLEAAREEVASASAAAARAESRRVASAERAARRAAAKAEKKRARIARKALATQAQEKVEPPTLGLPHLQTSRHRQR